MDIQHEVQVIERALKKRGVKQTALADHLGIRVPAVTELFQGKRRLQIEEKIKAYQFLHLDSVPLKGYVSAGSQAEFYELPEDELDRVAAPEDVTENTVAVEIRGDSLGAAFNGWLAYYNDVQRPITRSIVGKLCVVGLSDGRVLIKKPVASTQKGLFHLVSSVGETILDVPIEWAARVIQMRPRS